MENRENWNGDEKKKERKKEEGRRGRRRNLLVQVSLVSWKTNIKKREEKGEKEKRETSRRKFNSWDISTRCKSDKFGGLCRVSATIVNIGWVYGRINDKIIYRHVARVKQWP